MSPVHVQRDITAVVVLNLKNHPPKMPRVQTAKMHDALLAIIV
jgi:hypothetical protein